MKTKHILSLLLVAMSVVSCTNQERLDEIKKELRITSNRSKEPHVTLNKSEHEYSSSARSSEDSEMDSDSEEYSNYDSHDYIGEMEDEYLNEDSDYENENDW